MQGYTDDELDAMFGDTQDDDGMMQQQGGAPSTAIIPLPPLELLPLGQTTPNGEGLLTKKVAGLPVWAIGLGTLVLGGGAAWWYYTSKKLKDNDGSDEPDLEPIERGPAGWGPSRGRVGDTLKAHFAKKGITGVKVWDDAEAAKKARVKHRSPLVTCTIATGKLAADNDLQKLCKREGLQATLHEDGSIGLYPGTGKKAKEWEKYIDELRDDGQTD